MADSGTSSSRACDTPLVGEPGARKGARHSHVRRLSRSPRTGACGRRSLLVSAILAGGLLVALTVPPLGCSSRSPAPKACPVRVKHTPPAGWAAHRIGTTTTGKSWSLPFESALGTESSCGFPGAPADGRAPLPPAVSFSSPIQERDSSPDARYRKREILQPCGLWQWRDPDSNRGHHVFSRALLAAKFGRFAGDSFESGGRVQCRVYSDFAFITRALRPTSALIGLFVREYRRLEPAESKCIRACRPRPTAAHPGPRALRGRGESQQ